MNKKTILPLAITLALALNASAQTSADTRHTAAWSMDSCMSYAVKHSTDVQLQLVERRQARADYRWAKAGFLPQVGNVAFIPMAALSLVRSVNYLLYYKKNR